jgi:predicted RNA binding protein YcfA (HicA-like mRNA interferase family)
MPKPVLLSLILRVLGTEGFFFVRQKGSHARFRKTGSPTKNVTIKMSKKEIPYGTFQSILLQSGLKEDNFFEQKEKN